MKRLVLAALPGDAGGPVLDSAGGLLGMLLPTVESTRTLPEDVRFVSGGAAIQAALSNAGVSGSDTEVTATLDPVDLGNAARDMTVLVSCWD